MNNLDQLGNPTDEDLQDEQEWVQVEYDDLEVGKYYIEDTGDGFFKKVQVVVGHNNNNNNMNEGEGEGEGGFLEGIYYAELDGAGGVWENINPPNREEISEAINPLFLKRAIGINANNNVMMDGGRKKGRKNRKSKTRKGRKGRKGRKTRKGRKMRK